MESATHSMTCIASNCAAQDGVAFRTTSESSMEDFRPCRLVHPFIVPTQGLSRRRFVQGLAAGGVLAGLSTPAFKAFAQQGSATRGAAPVLKGTEFDLVIAESPVNFTGKPGVATTINGSLPAPTLRWREGDTVTIRVTNKLREATSIHWHGIILPYQMDGVPGISFNGIAPARPSRTASRFSRAAPTGTTRTPASRNSRACTGRSSSTRWRRDHPRRP